MGALLALVPTKDWFLGAFIALLGVLCWHFYDKYEDAVNYRVTVQAESKAALAEAKQTIVKNDTDYKAALASEKLEHAQDNLAAAQQHNLDVARLLAAAPARQGNTALGGATAASAGTASRPGGAESLSGLPEQAVVCQGLSDALQHDDDILIAERAERDSLTGK